MLLANIILASGIWIFITAEVWCSKWIRRTGCYVGTIVLLAACLSGVIAVGLGLTIADLKKQQAIDAAVPATLPPQSVLPAPTPTALPQLAPKPTPRSKEPLQILGLSTTRSIMISNPEGRSVFVLSLLVTIDQPFQFESFPLGFEIPAEGFKNYDFPKKFATKLITLDTPADTLEATLTSAKQTYGESCIQIVTFSDSDSQFMPFAKLGAFKEHATLSYRLRGSIETSTQDIPVSVIPMRVDGCQKVDKP